MEQEYQFEGLLLEIKCFLSKNLQIQGAFNLLARLDSHINKLIRKESHESSEYIQLKSDSQTDNNQILTHISPRKFTNILDIFIIDYSFEIKQYQIIPVSLSGLYIDKDVENDRRAILQLVLGPVKEHVVEKEKTASMTELHKLTSNLPKNSPPLILPNYSLDSPRYTYIYQTKQCMQYDSKYYLIDRYFCFVVDGICNTDIDAMFKSFKGCIFEERLRSLDDPFQAGWDGARRVLKAVIPLLVDKANQQTLSLCCPASPKQLECQLQLYLQPLKETVICSMLVLLTYLTISQYKIIFYLSKQNKHILSDLIISLQQSLLPLRYVYPVVFCSLNSNHCDFIESPVPIIVAFWGSDKRRQRFARQLQDFVKGTEKCMDTIVIDLDKNKIKCMTNINNQDVFTLQKMQKWVKKYGKGNCQSEKISAFIRETIQGIQEQSLMKEEKIQNTNSKTSIKKKKQQKAEWLKILEKKIKGSQMYQIHKV